MQKPQSIGQVLQLSLGLHVPSPHAAQRPQSSGHVPHVSLPLHVMSPQVSQRPQSVEHEKQSSPGLHVPSPHEGQSPQSSGQLEHVSPAAHIMSPHVSQVPQSSGHDAHDSPSRHAPSPHPGHEPQSTGQVSHDSVVSHVPLPHMRGTSGSGPSVGGASGRAPASRSSVASEVRPHALSATIERRAKGRAKRRRRDIVLPRDGRLGAPERYQRPRQIACPRVLGHISSEPCDRCSSCPASFRRCSTSVESAPIASLVIFRGTGGSRSS